MTRRNQSIWAPKARLRLDSARDFGRSLNAFARGAFGPIPIWRWTGDRFDRGNESAVDFRHQRREIIDDLTPSFRAADRILTTDDRPARDRQDQGPLESDAIDQPLN